jgi:serine/threonine-protein kinase
MNSLKRVAIVSVVASLFSIGIPTLTLKSVAEDPPAETYNPGPWQPVARVNPEAAIQVNIINQTGVSLEYSLTTGEIEIRQVAAGQTAELTNLPKDAYILINPQASQFSIQLDIKVTEDNLVNITVQPSVDPSGESTVNIQSNGGIYQY